jgi:hypothetical protein
MDTNQIRSIQHALYDRLKRNKAISPPAHGLMLAVVDGHETHASRRRCCPGCLERKINTKEGQVIEYYHRIVGMVLVGRDMCFQLDAEMILSGEDEVAAAKRLLDRAVRSYPRAFDVVGGDALYARSDWFNHVKAAGKDAIAVLKQEQRDLYQDASSLWETMPPVASGWDEIRRECWDLEGFKTWPQCHHEPRVVRALEKRRVKRQLDGRVEEQVSHWVWVTTLEKTRASTRAVVQMGHGRWTIENQGFNEGVNHFHADHVYRHQEKAMEVMWLWTLLAMNLFLAFFRRNLRPITQKASSKLHIARCIMAELHGGPPPCPGGP